MNGPLGASQCNLKAPTIFVDEGEIADKSLLPIKGKFTIKDLRTANEIPISMWLLGRSGSKQKFC